MANQLLSKTQTPTLTWAAIAGAQQYEVQFATDQAFKVLEQDITGLLTASVTPAALSSPQKHFWRFRALLSTTLYADQANTAGSGAGNSLRDVAADTYLAQGFTTASWNPVKRVSLSLKAVGAPNGNVWAELWTSSGGGPLAFVAASATMAASGLTGAFATYNFDFANPVAVTLNTVYYVVLRGDFGIDGANYVQWQKDAGGVYSGGAAFKGDATPNWTTNGAACQIFTTYYYKWGTWQPVRAVYVNTAFAAGFTPATTGWAFVDPDDTSDSYQFAVAPHYEIAHKHQRRSQVKNIQGDMLTEYVSTRDAITLTFDNVPKGQGAGVAYVAYDQMAELVRFFQKRKSLFLIAVTDYGQDKQERVWKVDFTDDPYITPLAPGREDFFNMILPLQESVLQ